MLSSLPYLSIYLWPLKQLPPNFYEYLLCS
jgi:hypothetical protein